MTTVSGQESVEFCQPLPKCVPWEAKYREGILNLFKDVPHKRELWSWQFESNPFFLPFDPVVLVDADDQVVGFNGVMPVLATDGGEDIPVMWSCDFFLAEQWRGQGLGSQIKHKLHEQCPIIMAFGISDRASEVLQHLGWVSDASVRSYRMIRRLSGWRSCVFFCIQLINLIYKKLFGSKEREFPSDNLALSVHSSLPARHRVDDLWRRCASSYDRIVQRSYRYLDWRYQKHPLGRYAFVHAEMKGELKGMLVVRIHGEHLRIVDYVGPGNNQQLKQALVDYSIIRWRHATHVSAVTSDDQLGGCFTTAGFVKVRGRPRFFRYETRASAKAWFIMAGDSDGEFLQAASDFCNREGG